jgi:restriction system protein
MKGRTPNKLLEVQVDSMVRYWRIMPGAKSMHLKECMEQGFIGGDWGMPGDLTNDLSENWRDFNKSHIPIYLATHPEKTKVAAGLACGMLHTICKGMPVGSRILCPDGSGVYRVGEVVSEYFHEPSQVLPHRRKVKWFATIKRSDMSNALKNSSGSIGTVSDLSKYAEELSGLIAGKTPELLTHTDTSIEDPSVFALEKHLEDFLVANWSQTELAANYDIFEEEGELVGQQYPSDTGPLDILAVSKDKRTLLVIELKKGRASDAVVGQIQRYMGYVKEELAEPGQDVRGIIIALDDDLRLRRALSVANNIEFFNYQVSFSLSKVI